MDEKRGTWTWRLNVRHSGFAAATRFIELGHLACDLNSQARTTWRLPTALSRRAVRRTWGDGSRDPHQLADACRASPKTGGLRLLPGRGETTRSIDSIHVRPSSSVTLEDLT